jgi:outer membrane protein TolC
MKTRILVALAMAVLLFCGTIKAQQLSLKQCIDKANARSASAAQLPLIKEALAAQQSVANANYLPKTSLNGTATWQSEVTGLNISLPNIDIRPVPKDQYKLTLDLQQNLFDGGLTKAQKTVNERQARLDESRIESELYGLKEMVVQYYYNTALVNEQLVNLTLVKEQIAARLKKTAENQKFGTATASQTRQIEARLVELEQQGNDLKSRRTSLLKGLELLTGERFGDDFVPTISSEQQSGESARLKRPEIAILNSQIDLTLANKSLITSRYAPKVSVFGTLGYGRPGLNFLSTDFSTYGIVGLNVKIPIDQVYTKASQREQALLDVQASRAKKQVENFELQQNIKIEAQKQEIERLKESLKTDERLVELRLKIKKTTENQLDNGIITPADYLEESNNELIARQSQAMHRVQLALAIVQQDILLGVF